MALKRVALGIAIGYVIGAKAGEKRFEELKELWGRITESPLVGRLSETSKRLASGAQDRAASLVDERLGEQDDDQEDHRQESRDRDQPDRPDQDEDRQIIRGQSERDEGGDE